MNISLWWNFGSLLGLCLIIQILTGLFLAIHYSSHTRIAFDRVVHICRDVNYGWVLRAIHANGASFFFIFMYLHVGRGIYYGSYKFIETWIIGVTIILASIATAFLGYVLPWGQISLWGAIVITNLLSTAPYIGPVLVQWLWGGFSIDSPTLTRFFALHYLLPFIILILMVFHIIFLHLRGSNNPLGLIRGSIKIPFHPYFTVKDLVGGRLTILILLRISLWAPYSLGDPENFNTANPLRSPIHIQPEWYYLFAYAILRSIPDKLGGVIALLISILVFYLFPFIYKRIKRSNYFYPINLLLIWRFFSCVFLLTWIGANPVEPPFILCGRILTGLYFLFFLTSPIVVLIQDFLLKKKSTWAAWSTWTTKKYTFNWPQ